jgi:hypothetical protein
VSSELGELRTRFHRQLLGDLLVVDEKGVASNADKKNVESCKIAEHLQLLIGPAKQGKKLSAQTAGAKFESIAHDFVRDSFALFVHMRHGLWKTEVISKRSGMNQIARFGQYRHLIAIAEAASKNNALAIALGHSYVVAPDIVISREPEPDTAINSDRVLVDGSVGTRADIRQLATGHPIMHASVSCKWTLRSDRSQNARSESLNLLRNRTGRAPHIAVITAEPLPSRISSISLGTGDIDCVYHIALNELVDSVDLVGAPESKRLLHMMVDGGRLKDVADLSLDLIA